MLACCDPDIRRRLVDRKLNDLLSIAAAECPFYALAPRPKGPEGALALLRHWPVLKRSDLFVSGEQIRTGRPGKLNHTGGSTGEPVSFLQDSHYWRHNYADKVRTYRMCGFDIGNRGMWVWGSDSDSRTRYGVLSQILERIAGNIVRYRSFSMTHADRRRVARHILTFRPQLVVGYASFLEDLAQMVLHEGMQLTVGGIQSSAEVLTQPARQVIEIAFGAPVFDRYGAREFGNIAHECHAHHGLHVLQENNWVELLNDQDECVPEGDVGRIVVTNLNNYAQPFIRYDTGDLGVWDSRPCSCGRSLPRLERIVGRKNDVIRTASGQTIHGVYFTHLFFGMGGVHAFQVVQSSLDRILIRMVAPIALGEAERHIREEIRECSRGQLHVSFEYVSSISPSPSGKRRFVISRLEPGSE